MSYDPTLILNLAETTLEFANNNLHWCYVVVTVVVDPETDEEMQTAEIVASESHIDPLQYWESDGLIYYKIGHFSAVVEGKRTSHLLWESAAKNVTATSIINNIYNETTVINNNNTTVVYVSQTPSPGSARVFRNGIRLHPSEYTSNGLAVTLNLEIPLAIGEKIQIKFAAWKAGELVMEVPTGAIDGDNQEFELTQPYDPETSEFYLNGVLQDETQVTPGPSSVTFAIAPYPGETIIAFIKPLPTTGSKYNVIPEGAIDGENTDFTIPFDTSSGIVKVYLSGPLQSPITQYSKIGDMIRFAEAPYPGQWIIIDHELNTV